MKSNPSQSWLIVLAVTCVWVSLPSPSHAADAAGKTKNATVDDISITDALVRVKRKQRKFASIVNGEVQFDFSEPDQALSDRDKEAYELFKSQQISLVLHSFVLGPVMKQPGVVEVSFLKGEKVPNKIMARLRDALEVDFPGDIELMRIRVRADNSKEAAFLANTVKRVYLTEVVEAINQAKLLEYERLSVQYDESRHKSLKERAKLLELERSSGVISSPAVEADKERTKVKLDDIKKKAAELSLASQRLDLEIKWLRRRNLERDEKLTAEQKAHIAKLEKDRELAGAERDFYIKEFENGVAKLPRAKEYSDSLEVRRRKVEFLEAATRQLQLELQVREMNMIAPPRIENMSDATSK